jgi:D-alanyl-D-alanine carboxypeptidase (penicillin-binding protein 5/6)
MPKTIFKFLILLSSFCLLAHLAPAQTLPRQLQDAQFYFLIDGDTKEVILSKNADVRISPSSMTKMMTAYVVFDQVRKGNISFNNQCLIGKDAWRKSGSSMFLNYGDVVTIEELLKGLLVVSGNDAAIALAEAAGGGYNNFINLMNAKAREIGLKNSHFRNPHGLNEEGHYMSLRDLAMLAIHIYQDFPQYSHFFSITEFTYGNITQKNRNPLIKENYDGVVGGKTGHTNQGGYGVIGIVKRDHRRLIAVVNKAKTPKQRSQIITELFDYGFDNYKKLVLFEKGQDIAYLPTWLGLKDKISVVTNQQIALNILRTSSLDDVKVKVKFKGPIHAPIANGAKIADLVIEVKGYKNFEYSLFAKERVDKVGILEKISIITRYKFNNFINKNF